MKRLLLLITTCFFFSFVSAQEILIEELPEVIQRYLLADEDEYNADALEDTFNLDSSRDYYSGLKRTFSTDTIYYYDWDRPEETWRNHHRVIKTYDNDEHLVSLEIQHWKRPGEWANGIFKEFIYMDGLLTEIFVKVWHPRIQQWQNFHHKVLTRYDNGKVETELFQKWHYPAQSWIDRSKRKLEYNADLQLIADTLLVTRPMTQEWNYAGLTVNGYDPEGFPEETLRYKWIGDLQDWIALCRISRSKGGNGLIDHSTWQHWFRPANDWMNVRRVDFYYDAEDMLTERVEMKWHPDANAWAGSLKHLFIYDPQAELDTMITQVWVPRLSEWRNKILDDFEYDGYGTLLSRLTRLWNPRLEDWMNFRLMEMVIDLKNVMGGIEQDHPAPYGIELLFPNPYLPGETILVRSDTRGSVSLELFSVNGGKVWQKEIPLNQPFSMDNSPVPGLYIMTVTFNGRKVDSKKMLITY